MKHLLIILFFLSSFTHSQTLKGVISLSPKKGIGDDTELSEKAKKPMLFGYTYSNKISTQELLSSERTSIDTIFIEHERLKDVKFETTATTIRAHKAIHYKNYDSNIYRFESSTKNENLVTEDLSIKDSIPLYKWTLEPDTQKIAGYLCKKAKTIKTIGNRTQKITAWYCEDIPINDGPLDFSGLPGLIMKIENGKNVIIKFERIKFFRNETIEIKEPKNNANFLTMSEYFQKLANGN